MGTGMENGIPEFREREWEQKIAFQILGTGMKNSFPNFGNENGRTVFPGMVGSGNSRWPAISDNHGIIMIQSPNLSSQKFYVCLITACLFL